MWADMFRDTCCQRVVSDQSLDTTGGESMKIASSVHGFAAAVTDEQWLRVVGTLI